MTLARNVVMIEIPRASASNVLVASQRHELAKNDRSGEFFRPRSESFFLILRSCHADLARVQTDGFPNRNTAQRWADADASIASCSRDR